MAISEEMQDAAVIIPMFIKYTAEDAHTSRSKSRVQYWWLLFMEANRFDQVIPAINGVSIAVQEDFLGGALRFSRRILPEGSCFRKVQVGETWYVFFFWGGRG